MSTTPIPFAVYGDSTSARDTAWLPHVDETVRHVGGYVHSGDTSADVLEHAQPVAADVTVIMLGTNDVRLGLTKPSRMTTKRNIEAIATASRARRVLLCAIAPCDLTAYGPTSLNRQSLGYALNRDYSQLAADHGWLFADPWSSVRLSTNGWVDDASSDGVHPTDLTSATYTGPRMSLYIRQALSGADLITNGA